MYTHDTCIEPTPSLADSLLARVRGLAKLPITLNAMLERNRQRRRLLELNDYLLKDIGLNRAQVEHETSKPFWRD